MPEIGSFDSVDTFYTPPWIASEMAHYLGKLNDGQVVADFSAGDGALLRAVEEQYGSRLSYIATDFDESALRSIGRRHPTWTVGKIDLLSAGSRRASKIWRTASQISAVLLNPPFSFRGGGGRGVVHSSGSRRLTPASSFVSLALNAVSDGAVIMALLPSSSLDNERDIAAWAEWARVHEVQVVKKYPRGAFAGAYAETILVRVLKSSRPKSSTDSVRLLFDLPEATQRAVTPYCVEVIRGRVPVHRATIENSKKLDGRFLHTTDLRNSSVIEPKMRLSGGLATRGPILIVPRVGSPTMSKIVLVRNPAGYILSDCLLAVRPRDKSSMEALVDDFLSRCEDILQSYRGSCAKYLRVSDLVECLERWNWCVEVVEAASTSSPCLVHDCNETQLESA